MSRKTATRPPINQGAGGSPPGSAALIILAMISTQLWAPTFAQMLLMWAATVPSSTTSSRAMAGLRSPLQIRVSTCASRSNSPKRAAVPARRLHHFPQFQFSHAVSFLAV